MRITRPSRRIIQGAIFSLLFVFMQTATLLHAETHHFHNPTDLCKIFQSSQNHSGGVSHVDTLLQALFLQITSVSSQPASQAHVAYTPSCWSRAPPSVS